MMLKQHYRELAVAFVSDHAVYWNNLSRLNNLLVIMNISMFFLTGLVSKGYYYTFYSLFFLGVVALGCIVPTRWVRRLGYYTVFLGVEITGLYFLAASIVFWVEHS
jgi:hypothetical protein